MPIAAKVNIERVPPAGVALARSGSEPKSLPARARSGAETAARRRELAKLLRAIRGLMRQPH